jgi:hypothetical protein
MLASLQSLGSSSVSKEHCSMVFSIGARCIAHSFNIGFGILSGPDVFAGFMFVNNFFYDLLINDDWSDVVFFVS